MVFGFRESKERKRVLMTRVVVVIIVRAVVVVESSSFFSATGVKHVNKCRSRLISEFTDRVHNQSANKRVNANSANNNLAK